MSVTVHHGDCLDVLRGMGEASVDSVVTDPPAGISFMGKDWDHHKGGRDAWIAWMREVAAECLRVAKPGAHALVWALPRTSHWTATAWEDAGWQVRDRVAFLHGCGFPKGKNQLKPAVEDWWLLRKPLACPTVAAQVLETGTGALNIAATRVPMGDEYDPSAMQRQASARVTWKEGEASGLRADHEQPTYNAAGRYPANLCHDGSPEVLEAFGRFGERTSGAWNGHRNTPKTVDIYGSFASGSERPRAGDTGTAARFFPALGFGEGELAELAKLAKLAVEDPSPPAGRWPANLVHDGSPEVMAAFEKFGAKDSTRANGNPNDTIRPDQSGYFREREDGARLNEANRAPTYRDTGTAARFFPALGFGEGELRFHYGAKANKRDRMGTTHPTTKPISLISWLCKLVCPPGGTILDPFAGSGTLAVSAHRLGFKAVLIEREREYYDMILKRLEVLRSEDACKAQGQRAPEQGELLDVA